MDIPCNDRLSKASDGSTVERAGEARVADGYTEVCFTTNTVFSVTRHTVYDTLRSGVILKMRNLCDLPYMEIPNSWPVMQ